MEVFLIYPKSEQAQKELAHELVKKNFLLCKQSGEIVLKNWHIILNMMSWKKLIRI